MQRQVARLAALAGHLEMRHTFACVPKVPDLELAELHAPQRVEQQRGENGAIALALNRVVRRRVQQLARLMIAERRRLAFGGFHLRPLDAFDRVMGDGVLVAEIFEQRCERRQPMPDGAAAKPTLGQLVAPRDDVRAGDSAEFLRPADAGEAHEVADGVFVGAAGAGVAEIGEPLDLGRHVRQPVKLGRGQHPRSTRGGNVGWKLVGHRFARLRLTSFVRGRRSPSAAVLRSGSFLSVDQVKITLDRDRHDDGSVVEKPKVGVRCLKRSAQFPFRFGLRRRLDEIVARSVAWNVNWVALFVIGPPARVSNLLSRIKGGANRRCRQKQ